MERRAFLTSALAAAGFLAIFAGTAEALTAVAPPIRSTPTGAGDIEKAWWRRRWGWRRHWGWRRWRRW